MIDCHNFAQTTLKKLDELTIGQSLDIRSFKRNRKVVITKTADGYTLVEDGFAQNTFAQLDKDALAKLLRAVEKREFPRSNKLRFYVLGTDEESVNRANYRLDAENILSCEEDSTFLVRINCDYNKFETLKHLIAKGQGVIEDIQYAHVIHLTVRLEEPLFAELSQLLWVPMHRL